MLGAFDPFQEIAALCKKHKVWMHVDGCWGAAALLSPEHRHLMKGCELSDSLAWNPHKLMGLPLQCSAFLTTHKGQQRSVTCPCTASCCTLPNLLYIAQFVLLAFTRSMSDLTLFAYACMAVLSQLCLAHTTHQKLRDQRECLLQAYCSRATHPMPAISFSQTS